MLRLVMTSILCMLVSFGVMARSSKANALFNHVSEHHVTGAHSHEHRHDHDQVEHSHENSEKPHHQANNHSHQFELSLLTQAIHVDNQNPIEISTSVISYIAQTPTHETPVPLSDFTFSIFRPPIA